MPHSEQKLQIIQTHTFHPHIDDFYGEIFDTYKIEEIRPLQKLIWQVHKLEIGLSEFLKKTQDLQIKDFETRLWPKILRFDFLPVADALGLGLDEWIDKLPADLQKNLAAKIITTEKWAGDYILANNLEFSPEGRRRLVFVAGEYLRGEKTPEEIKDQLVKPFKVGGLEIELELAEKIVGDLISRCEEASANDEIFTSQKIGEFRMKQETQPQFKPALPKPLLNTPQIGIAKEIKADIAEMQKTSDVKINLPASNGYEAQAEEIIKQSGVAAAPDLRQRFKMIIISRLREVRKPGETKERLLAHTLNGGMGLSAEMAEKVMVLVEETKKKETKTPSELVPAHPEIALEKPLAIPPTESVKALQSAPNLVKPPAQPPVPSPVTSVEALPQSKPPVVKPPVTAPPTLSKPAPSAIKSSLSSSSAVPSTADIRPAASPVLKITEEKSKPKIEEITMPVASKPPVTTAIPQTASGRAKLEDVAYKPRLMGPIEELKEMDFVEFRRLSPKPRVAADKITAKVDLLAKEGYERKLKGVEAWQKSPLNQLYKEMLSESLNKAKAIAQIIAEKTSAKQDVLSEEEFKVIMELNKLLRF